MFDEMYNSVASERVSYGGDNPTSAVREVYLQHEVTLYGVQLRLEYYSEARINNINDIL